MLQLLKPVCLEPVLHSKRSHRNEKPMRHSEGVAVPAAPRESPNAAMKTQCEQKIRKEKKGEREPGRDILGGPVVRTPHFHCRGPGFDPG